MLRLCDIREKIVDKVKDIKNHRENRASRFYYIYSSTEKKGNERKENFKLHHLKQDQPHLSPAYSSDFPPIRFRNVEAQNQGFPD